jgi:hypothetical protein
MHRTAGLIALFLFAAPLAFAAESKTPAASPKPKGTVMKMDAEEVFAFVESVTKDPTIDRAKARKFLQNAMDGKVRMFEVEVAEEGSTTCVAKACRTRQCKKCNLDTGKCFCSTCCAVPALH